MAWRDTSYARRACDGELCFVCELGLRLSGRFVWASAFVVLDGFFSDPARWVLEFGISRKLYVI